MSESDDTDVLLLIPPDIFRVPSSSDSENSSADHVGGESLSRHRTGVISELVGHMQSLESRVSAIESRDTSLDVSVLNNSLDSQPTFRASECQPHQTRQTLPRAARFTVSQGISLHGSPVRKPRNCLSVPSTPSGSSPQKHANCSRNDTRPVCRLATTTATSPTNTNNPAWTAKHDTLTYSDSSAVPSASCGTGFSHATAVSTTQDSRSPLRANNRTASTSNLYYRPHSLLRSSIRTTDLTSGELTADQQPVRSRIVQEMELSEVDELLQEMEATELELSKRINSAATCQYRNESFQTQLVDSTSNQETSGAFRLQHKPETSQDHQRFTTNIRKLDFQSCTKDSQLTDAAFSQKRTNDTSFPDVSLPYSDTFYFNETDKMISDFRTWEQSVQPSVEKSNGHIAEGISSIRNTVDLHLSNAPATATAADFKTKEPVPERSASCADAGTSSVRVQSSLLAGSVGPHIRESIQFPSAMATGAQEPLDLCKTSQHNGNSHNDRERSEPGKSIAHVATNTDLQSRYLASTRILSATWSLFR